LGEFIGEFAGSVGEMLEPRAECKPRLRGVLHQWAFLLFLPLGLGLVVAAGSARARIAVAVYVLSVVALFGTSALYHRVDWRSLTARRWMRRLDHSMIFVLIAGTYTPFALVALHGPLALAILVTVWAGALAGIGFNLVLTGSPTWLRATLCVALGWVVVAALPQLAAALGVWGTALVALGGVLYTLGAIVYSTKRPDPRPSVFGYHEVFHALVIVAAALQYAVIALWIAPN
jgi:hemolysin III